MGLEYGGDASEKFVTNVGLITSNGPNGHNVMAAEWTHHVSYNPPLVTIHIHSHDATAENIMKSKEFGVNLAAENQNVASSVSGGAHGQEVDKIAVLKELGFEFYKAKKINALMIKGAAMNAECRVIKQENLGDHVVFVGEAVEVSADESKKPLVYFGGKYLKVGEQIQKPQQEVLDKIRGLMEKHRK